ncbi:OadG-related small transporter subunit [Clostridium thermarum]|nr:OadG-related small transporter subunit [Clostridium thermarum]
MELFKKSLELMVFGMAGIFAVTFIIYLTIKLLHRLFPQKD